MRVAALLLGVVLTLAWALPASASPEKLPPGVVARVYGRDITERELLDVLARRHEGTERGKRILEQLVDDAAVAQEAKRRNVTVTEEETREYLKKVDNTIRESTGGDRSIQDVLREQHTTEDEFRRIAREYLLRQKMAVVDLGAPADQELPEHRLKLWLSSIRRAARVKLTELPDGVLAQVGDTTIDRTAFARALREHLPAEIVSGSLQELILQRATEYKLAEAKLEVTDADVEADLAVLRKRFSDDPRVRGTGLTFEQFLRQTRGTGEAELRRDAAFRARVGLQRLVSRDVTDADVRSLWEKSRDAYGERALVRYVYVQADDEGAKFKMRTFREAYELTLRAKVAVLEATGAVAAPNEPPRRPVGEALTMVAKQFEEDTEKRTRAGEPMAWTRATVGGEPTLAKAAFEGELGQLQGPIRSSVGYYLLVVEERRAAPPFEDVRDVVRDDLVRERIGRFQLALRADENVILPASR